ncbi:MAG: Plastocyanin, partial [Candidatus Jorgensenbacteria bacterium GW2011_GWA1_48_11]
GIRTKTIQGGQSETVEFTPSEEGTFAFYCSVSNHRLLGMEGSLEVK